MIYSTSTSTSWNTYFTFTFTSTSTSTSRSDQLSTCIQRCHPASPPPPHSLPFRSCLLPSPPDCRAVNSTTTFVTGQWQGANPAFHRPSLSINYTTGSKQPIATYPVRLGAVPRTWWVNATAVNDDNNSGHADSPFTSLAKAVFEAWPGDSIYLMSGVYAGEWIPWLAGLPSLEWLLVGESVAQEGVAARE